MAKGIAITGNLMPKPLIYSAQASRIVTRLLSALEDPAQLHKKNWLKSGNYRANPKRLIKMIEANFVLNYLIKLITGWRLGLFLYPRVMRNIEEH